MSKKIIHHLFNYAAQEEAKGFTIESAPEKVALNYKFPGGEERSFGLPKKLEKDLSLALRQVLKLAPDELTTKKYCKIEDKNYRLSFHLTIIPSQFGEKIIINIIPKNHQLLSLKQLGMQKNNQKIIQDFLHHNAGLALISSPHGQGKNTSLYTLLKELSGSTDRSIYLIADRPEYKIDGVNNLLNTKNVWDKILNIDSEIIATEINTPEELKNATLVAESGRLVIASITANSVWEVLLAYLKLKLPLKQKLDSLKIILNQRITPLTRSPKKISLKKRVRKEIGLFEILEITPTIKKFLIESEDNNTKDKFWEELSQLALKDGYEPLIYDRAQKIKNGLVSTK
jgi:type II secretory ATPase GspE/PulE/Tfp pilus assembly ATPase PilB-like protein